MTDIERRQAQLRPTLKTHLLEGIIEGNVQTSVRTFVDNYIGKNAEFTFGFHGGNLNVVIEQQLVDAYEKFKFSFIILE